MPTISQLIRKPRTAQKSRNKVPALRGLPAEARRLHPRLHHDAEEAELGAAQGRQGAAHQRLRGDRLHPGRGPQPPGALGGDDPRRAREGPAGRALPHPARRARHAGREEQEAAPVARTAPSGRSDLGRGPDASIRTERVDDETTKDSHVPPSQRRAARDHPGRQVRGRRAHQVHELDHVRGQEVGRRAHRLRRLRHRRERAPRPIRSASSSRPSRTSRRRSRSARGASAARPTRCRSRSARSAGRRSPSAG